MATGPARPGAVRGGKRAGCRKQVGQGAGSRRRNRRYTVYLTIVALAGWSLASYDLNLLVLTVSDVAQELNLSGTLVGSLIFFVPAAQFVVTLFIGYGMDTAGYRPAAS